MTPNRPNYAVKTASPLPRVIAVGAVTFALGVSGAMLFAQKQNDSQTEMLTAIVLQLQQQQQQPVQVDVTRAATPALMAVAPPEEEAADLVAISAKPAAEPRRLDLTAMASALTDGMIIDPNFDSNTATRAETLAVASADVNDIAAGILDGDYTVTSYREEGGPARLALAVTNREATSASLEVLLARAVASGNIAVPEAYASNDGSVDPQTLLFDLVQRSLENGSLQEVAAAAELRRRASAVTLVSSQVVDNVRYYTVEPGDGLAYIALQFYGSTRAYVPIFEANRNLIPTPDQIQIGQRLVIPNV